MTQSSIVITHPVSVDGIAQEVHLPFVSYHTLEIPGTSTAPSSAA